MQPREIWFITIAVAIVAGVCIRAVYGQPPAQTDINEWRRKIVARGLAVIGLAIGIAVLLDNLTLKQ